MTQQITPKDEPVKTEEKAPEVKKKRTFWGAFVNFLMMGGFIVVLIVLVALFIGLSILFKCK